MRSALKQIWFLFPMLMTMSGCLGNGGDGPGNVHTPIGPGTGPAIDAAIFPTPGTTAFVTANTSEQLSSGTGQSHEGYNGGMLPDDFAESDAAAQPGDKKTDDMPEPDPNREIVEADLYKVEGDLLYVLNRYRGLVIIDLAVPDQPLILGRLPFKAVPTEMYIREGRAYIVMSDYFEYWMFDPDADPLGFHGSQILIADITSPEAPFALGSLPVEGEITDTRMVGDVIYAVSKRNPDYWQYNTVDWEDTTWVVSLNIANPQDIKEVERITFQGTSTLIHTAPHAVFVAATDPNYYLYDPGHDQETLVLYVDISDPSGRIQQRGKIYVPGQIADKFKMDYYEKTLRVFTQNYGNAQKGDLFVVDVSHPDDLRLAGSLTIDPDTWGSLQATRFSNDRAYAMTHRTEYNGSQYVQRQELHLISFPDLADPVLAGTILIDSSVSHFEVRGDNSRLLALGVHSTDSWPTYTRNVQLALFNVEDPVHPFELSQVQLGEGWSSSTANYDYKALKIFESINLILLPLSYWDPAAQTTFNGTQLVDWVGDQLTERGRIQNIDTVQRAFPIKDRLVTMSTQRLQVIDANNRDQPKVVRNIDLIRNVFDLFEIQETQVQLISDPYDGTVKFYVVPFGQDDQASPLATLLLPFVQAPVCFKSGNMIHMVGSELRRGQVVQVIHTADFGDPLHPRLRGDLELANDLERIYQPGYSFYYYYWSPNAGLALENRILPFTVRSLVEDPAGRRDFSSELRLIDMSDPDHPRITDANIPMNDFPFINKVTHGNVLYSTHVEQATTDDGQSLLYHVRSYLDRVDVSNVDSPVLLPSVNIPGWLVDVSEDGQTIFSIDYQWDEFGRRRNSLNVLRLAGDQAVLMEVLPVSDQVNRAVFRDRTIWLTTHKYPWWGVHSDTLESRQPYTVMNRVVIDGSSSMVSFSSARLHGYHFDLLDVEGSMVYLASNFPYGVLLLNAADPSMPVIVNSSRTIGYISRMVEHGGFLYAPLSWFGVVQIPTQTK